MDAIKEVLALAVVFSLLALATYLHRWSKMN